MKKAYIFFRFLLYSISNRSGIKKAKFIKKHNIFGSFGNNCFWQPQVLPSYPKNIFIGNNVTVTANVRFFEHDEINRMWNCDEKYKGEEVPYYIGNIIIEDNCVIGGNSIILYDVKIGHNSLVAAGSVVTKDVKPYSIVGGNPAKKIGDTRDLLKKRISKSR